MFCLHFTFDFSKYFCDAIFLTFSIWKGCARVFHLFYLLYRIWLLFMYTPKGIEIKCQYHKSTCTLCLLTGENGAQINLSLGRARLTSCFEWWCYQIHSKYKLHAAYIDFELYVLFVSETRLLNFNCLFYIFYISYRKFCEQQRMNWFITIIKSTKCSEYRTLNSFTTWNLYDIDMKIELFHFEVCFGFSLSSSQCISNKFSSWRSLTAHQFQTLYVTNRIVFCVNHLLNWNFIWINCLFICAKLYRSFKTTCLKTFTECIQSIFSLLCCLSAEIPNIWRTVSQTFSFFFFLSHA